MNLSATRSLGSLSSLAAMRLAVVTAGPTRSRRAPTFVLAVLIASFPHVLQALSVLFSKLIWRKLSSLVRVALRLLPRLRMSLLRLVVRIRTRSVLGPLLQSWFQQPRLVHDSRAFDVSQTALDPS